MKIINKYLSLLLVMTAFVGFSQEENKGDTFTYNKINVIENNEGTLKLSGGDGLNTNNLESKVAAPANNPKGTKTPGFISVSPNGGASYDIPIAVPPGINGVIPEVSLSYNSQDGIGMAGYGWNVSGVSLISRVAANKYYDDEIDEVDFGRLDRYAFNGNRLILKSGTYGGDGAVYETANYSNLKIVSHGVITPFDPDRGPLYFVVYYPDGSVAHYRKNYLTNYAITSWENPQGLIINYEYLDRFNVLYISKIKYGHRENSNVINEIQFLYNQNLKRVEQAFVGYHAFFRKKVLSDVIVKSNGAKYRSYKLTYNFTNLNYPRVEKIQEFSGDGRIANNPITFNYSNTQKSVSYVDKTSDLSIRNISQENSKTVSLDLTGNGKMEFLVYSKANKNKFLLFKDIQNKRTNFHYEINTGKFETIFSSTFLSHNNKIIPGQGITVVQNPSSKKVNFKVYANGTANPLYYQYTKTWNVPTYNYDYNLEDTVERSVKQKYISGDFNGDGLTDVLAIGKPYTRRTCRPLPPSDCPDNPQELQQEKGESDNDFKLRQQYDKENQINGRPPDFCYSCSANTINNKAVHFIDLKTNLTANFSNYAGEIKLSLSPQNQIETGDFNGDGKTDIMQVTKGKAYFYSLDKNNKLELLWEENNGWIGIDKPILLGDYNGDGKTDFMTPKEGGPTTSAGRNVFVTYLSRKNGFTVDYESKPFRYTTPGRFEGGPDLEVHNLIPVDIDGDGRTDIVHYMTITHDNTSDNARQDVTVYHNNSIAYNSNDVTDIRFILGGTTSKRGHGIHYPIPIALNSGRKNKNLDFASISDNSITSFSFTMDHREDVLLRSVENSGVEYRINYENMDASTDDIGNTPQIYQAAINETYPYANIMASPETKLVSSLQKISGLGSPILNQEFAYYNATYNVEGLGFVGFEGMAQSSWYTNDSERIFNVTKYDTKKRGALLAQYTLKNYYSFTIPTSNYLTKTIYNNTASLSSNKVFKLRNDSNLTQNSIDGTFTNIIYQYDAYNNPKKITTNYSGQGSRILDITYDNSLTGNYYIGRTITQDETKIIGGETFKTLKAFEYEDYLLTKKETTGHGTPTDVEEYDYDDFGNIIKKTVTPHNTLARIIEFKYDPSGRFLEKSIDVEGHVTTYEYTINNGTLKSETNHLGFKTKYDYDAWYRPTQITDYLGKSSTTEYKQSSSYEDTVTNTGIDGSGSFTIYDKLGRLKTKQEKDVLGQWIKVDYLYDKFNRIWKESEPYTGNAPSQWNMTNYDFYDRPTKQTLYTGKVINIDYSGLSITVDDGVKTVKKTNDAIGNIKQVTDPGGTINYTYFGNGNIKTANYGGTVVTREQDGWGRKTKLIDPAAGTYEYDYNGFGELIKEKTPKGETNYVYSSIGKLKEKTITGDDTDIKMLYAYNSTNKLLETISMTDANGNNSSYKYNYDPRHHRLNETIETNPYAKFTKKLTYDGFGRVDTEESIAQLLSNGKKTSKKVKNTYQNGALKTIRDSKSGEELWNISGLNARGQATAVTMGNNLLEESKYNPYGYLEENKVINNGGFMPVEMMALEFDFNSLRGTLNSRKNSLFSWSETFQYDNLDRLINFKDNDSDNKHIYDNSGRIETNTIIGDYNYTGRSYQVDNITLNTQGDLYYQQNNLQQVSYNAVKKPLEIYEAGKEKISYQYNAYMGRANMFYGDTQDDKLQRNNRKHYSFDGTMEIAYDAEANKTTFVNYIGGDAYTAPTIWRSEQGGTPNTEGYYYLYRDYLGSIIMISDKDGTIKEKRHFDAWGNVVKVADGNNNTLNKLTFLDRGYTGHEHLQGVSLIHMNGRLYDPKLRRFIAPDNHIQDPFNSQSFNRYGYAWNNPLMYTDLNGEFILETIALLAVLKVVIAALAVAVTAYALYQAYFSDDSEPGASPNQVATPNSNNSAFANSTGYITHPSLGKRLDQPSGISQGFEIPAVEFDEIPIHEGTQIINDEVSNGNQINSDSGFSITTEDVINTTLDFIPLAGGVNDIRIGFNEGNNWQVALGVGSIALDIVTFGSATIIKGLVKTGIKAGSKAAAKGIAKGSSNLWKVGSYNNLRGLEKGLDAHHVGQKAVMKKFAPNYNPATAPSILVPKIGHTIRGPRGIVSRSTSGFSNARQLLARDIFELRRVYPNAPNSSLQELIKINKNMYPKSFNK